MLDESYIIKDGFSLTFQGTTFIVSASFDSEVKCYHSYKTQQFIKLVQQTSVFIRRGPNLLNVTISLYWWNHDNFIYSFPGDPHWIVAVVDILNNRFIRKYLDFETNSLNFTSTINIVEGSFNGANKEITITSLKFFRV